jgi:hypothetical protein
MKYFINKLFIFSAGTFFLRSVFYPIISLAAEKIEYTALEKEAFEGFTTNSGGGQLSDFLSQSFSFGLALAVALTVIMIVWGGLEIMLSESVFNKEAGKKKINEALLGLGLALVSWLILYIINPEILNFKI